MRARHLDHRESRIMLPERAAQQVLDHPGPSDPAQRPGRHRRRLSALHLAALAIGLLSLAVRGSVLRDSYFITDDFLLMSMAVENDLTFDYLTRVHTGHFEPIGFTVMWLIGNFAPFSWGWAGVFLIGGQALLLLLTWQLMVELFGQRLLALAPFAMFAFSPLTIAAFTWLAAAIIWLPLAIATAGMLRFHVRYVRDQRRRDLVLATAWFIVGLASFEKILILLPFLVVFTIALDKSFGRGFGVIRFVRRHLLMWSTYGVLTLVYVVLYARGSRTEGSFVALDVPTLPMSADFISMSLGRTYVPGLIGGPWSWDSFTAGLAVVGSPRFFDWLAWTLVVVLVIGSIILRRHAGWYWAALATYLITSMAIIAVGRVAFFGPVFALETRYLADAALPGIVIIGICLMPLVGERSALTSEAERFPPAVIRWWRPVAMVAAVAVVTLSLHSISGYAAHSVTSRNSAPYVDTIRAEIASLPADVDLVDSGVPDTVTSPLFKEYSLVSRFVAPLVTPEERETLYNRRYYHNPYMARPDGRIVPAVIEPYTSSARPTGECFTPEDGRIIVPLEGELIGWDWMLKIGYLSDADFMATVVFGEHSLALPVVKGPEDIYARIPGSGNTVEFTGIPAGTNFCVSGVTVGTAAPQE